MAERLVREPAERARLDLARRLGISPRRLLGWEPAERHEQYDADGNLVGFTVVVREPEWSDDDRNRLLALGLYEDGVCDCGFHESVATDMTNHFTFENRTCPLCRGGARWARMQAADDDTQRKAHGENPPPGTPDPADGRRTYTKLLSPAEVEQMRRR